MSHVVTLQTKIHDPAAVAAACQRFNLAPPRHGTAELYSGEAEGLLVQLPGWQYPIVIDALSGVVSYDNYQEYWGSPEQLDRFSQLYAVEWAKLEARKKGYTVSETVSNCKESPAS
jgi:hypothetical protein